MFLGSMLYFPYSEVPMMNMITCDLIKGGNGNLVQTLVVCGIVFAIIFYIIAKGGK